MSIQIELTPHEIGLAEYVGTRRHEEAVAQGRPDCHGFGGGYRDGLDIHIEGACGEVAVAKALNVFYDGSVNTFKTGGDIGGLTLTEDSQSKTISLQVRTRSKDYYDLLIRPNDRDEDIFVLVTGVRPKYSIHGWVQAADVKREEFLNDYGGRPPAYFVPKTELKPLFSIYRIIALEWGRKLKQACGA